jgi:hypothetical protein
VLAQQEAAMEKARRQDMEEKLSHSIEALQRLDELLKSFVRASPESQVEVPDAAAIEAKGRSSLDISRLESLVASCSVSAARLSDGGAHSNAEPSLRKSEQWRAFPATENEHSCEGKSTDFQQSGSLADSVSSANHSLTSELKASPSPCRSLLNSEPEASQAAEDTLEEQFCGAFEDGLVEKREKDKREKENVPVSREKENVSPLGASSQNDSKPRSEGVHSAAKWAPNASTCAVCDAALGKRHFRSRHHCRSCGECVCAACSPHSIVLQNMSGLQRVCTPCATSAGAIVS